MKYIILGKHVEVLLSVFQVKICYLYLAEIYIRIYMYLFITCLSQYVVDMTHGMNCYLPLCVRTPCDVKIKHYIGIDGWLT